MCCNKCLFFFLPHLVLKKSYFHQKVMQELPLGMKDLSEGMAPVGGKTF